MQRSDIPKTFPTKSVVIVDDSRVLRGWLRVQLEKDPRLKVVGEADSAEAARQVIKQTNPDVITLDIEMPGMNGLDFLEKLMKLFPKPVVMISGATQSNSEASIKALSLGAVDCILKPGLKADEEECKTIARRVFVAACSLIQPIKRSTAPAAKRSQGLSSQHLPIILIGASTGGVAALEQVLTDVHVDSPPIVIVQHMPSSFLVSFAQSLNRKLPQDVGIARTGETLSAGQIRLAPAEGSHTRIRRSGAAWSCQFLEDDGTSLHCPSVDTLFNSAEPFSEDVIGVILTGLGRDGAEGLQLLHTAGAQTVGQDEATSVVYGMPRAAWQLGAVQHQLPLDQIGLMINRAVAKHAHTTRRSDT